MKIRLKATTTFTRVYETEVYDGETVEETVALEQGIYDNEPLDTAVERYVERNLGPDDDKTVVELVEEQGQEPDEAPVETLEGPGPSPDTPETAEGRSGARCNYGHTTADHERAGACERPGLGQRRRPHWLPEEVWLGVKVGEWPLTAFTSQESAERWAANAKWEPERQAHEQRRIWRVEIPVDTPTFKVETVPASTRLVEAQW